MSDKDQSRAPSNELDMDAYHSEGIDPGDHKTFNISPTVHSFNERFQGEDQSFPPMSTPGFDPTNMPAWWPRQLNPKSFTSPYGSPELIPNTSEDEPSVPLQPIPMHPSGGYTPVVEKQKGPFDLPIEGGSAGTRLGSTTTENRITSEDIANLLGKNHTYGAPLGNKNNLVYEVLDNPEIVGKLINDYKEGGKTLNELASELNVSRNAVIYRLNKAGVLGSKIDPETINKRDRDLLDKFNSGMSFGDIAKELGVSRNSVAGKIDRLKQRLGDIPVRDRTNPPPIGPSPRTSPTLPKLNLPEFEKNSDPEYEKALSDWMKNQFEGGPSEREFRGMSPEDFNKFNEFQQRRMQTHVANENEKDTIDHPLMNIFREWIEPSINKQQQAYEKAIAKQGKSAENTFKGADRNKYPLTYKIKDEDLLKEFDENAKYLAKARFHWDREGYDPELFKSEFKQRHDIKDELNERIKNLPRNKNSLDAFLNYLKDKIRDE